MDTLEINIYSSDPLALEENLSRPTLIFRDEVTVFSSNTRFNLYQHYELNSSIRNQVPEFQAVYDDENIQIAVDHTNIIIKNINFKGTSS